MTEVTLPRLTRESIRQRIELLEALESVYGAIEEVSVMESEPGELLNVGVSCRDLGNSPVTTAHALPLDVVLAGLHAMKSAIKARVEQAERTVEA